MRYLSKWIILSTFFSTIMFSLSFAETVVIGEGIRFSPADARPGRTVFMDIRFRVEGTGSSIPIDFSIIDATRTPDPSHPTFSGHFAPSPRSYTLAGSHTLPDPLPSTPRFCFNVYAHFPGTGLRSALLINNACLGAQIRLSNPGTGQRATFARSVPPGTPPSSSVTFDGRGVEFRPKNLNYGDSSIHLFANIDVTGSFSSLHDHFQISIKRRDITWTNMVNAPSAPGLHRVDLGAMIIESHSSYRFPSRLDYDINCLHYNVVYEEAYRRYSVDGSSVTSHPLIRDISLETRMHVISEGTGQRITLPEGRKVAPPPPGVKPARPGI